MEKAGRGEQPQVGLVNPITNVQGAGEILLGG